jgi:predicted Zn-dependent protease with MMP-like domain
MHLDSTEFELLVKRAYEKGLPEEFQGELENVAIVIEPLPRADFKQGPGRILLGLFEGVPNTATHSMFRGTLPSKITLFEKNILASSRDLQELEKLILEVLLHEVAHYFGYNEEQMVYMDAKLRKKLGRKPR